MPCVCKLIGVHRVMWGHGVTQLVEALRYKQEGRGIDSRWCHLNFHLHNPSGRTMVLESTQPQSEMSTRNNSSGKASRCEGLTTLPPLCADFIKIWKPQHPGILGACQGL
jgi:hypothetical protein